MAVAFVRKHFEATQKTSGTWLGTQHALAANVPAGNLLVLWVASDNFTASSPHAVAWVKASGGSTVLSMDLQVATHDSNTASAAGGTVGTIVVGIAPRDLVAGSDYIEINAGTGGIVAKAALCAEFSGVGTTISATAGSGTGASGSSATTSSVPMGDLVLALGSGEGNAAITLDSDTAGGAWAEPGGDGAVFTTGGGAGANVTMIAAYKIPTSGPTSQTYDVSGASDGGACIVALRAAPTYEGTDNLGLSDRIEIAVNATDAEAITDSVEVLRGIEVTDHLQASDNKNLLDPVTASFEADSNADGLADGWSILSGTFTCSLVLDPTDGTYCQEITNTGGTLGQIRSAAEWPYSQDGRWTATADLKWVSGASAPGMGLRTDGGDTTYLAQSTGTGAWARRIAGGTFPGSGGVIHAWIRVPAGTTVRVDAFRVASGPPGAGAYDSGPNADFTLVGSGPTFAHTDALGLTDAVSVVLVASRSDTVDLTDAATAQLGRPFGDTSGLTDAVSLEVGKGVTDYTNAGDAKNWLDATTASFEADSDADGLADGWEVVSGTATFTRVLNPTDGTWAQEIAATTTTQIRTVLPVPASPGGTWRLSGSVRLTAGSDGAWLGLTDGAGTNSSGTISTSYTRVSVTRTVGQSTGIPYGMRVTLEVTAGNTARFDAIRLIPGATTDTTYASGAAATTVLARGCDAADALGVTDTAALSAGRDLGDEAGVRDRSVVDADGHPGVDGAGLTDAVSTVLSRDVDLTDPLGLADVQSDDSGEGQQDTLGLTDLATTARTIGLTASDTAALSDAASPHLDRPFTDTASLADSVGTALGRDRQDALGITDSVAVALTADRVDTLGPADTDELAASRDLVDEAGLRDRSILDDEEHPGADLAGLTDAVAASLARDVQVSDPLGLTDAQGDDSGEAQQDTLGLTDSVAVAQGYGREATDSTGLTDGAATSEAGAESVTDTLGLTDATLAQLAISRTHADALGLTDQASASVGATAADAVGPSDQSTLAVTKSTVDTVGLADSVTTSGAGTSNFPELLGLTDTVVYVLTADRTEQAGLTDVASTVLAQGLSHTVTDLAGGTDSASASTALSRSDTAAFADAISQDHGRSFTDWVRPNPPKIVVIGNQGGGLGKYGQFLTGRGYDVTIRLWATTMADLDGFDVVMVDDSAYSVSKGALLTQAYQAGKAIVTTGNDTTNTHIPQITSTTLRNNSNGTYGYRFEPTGTQYVSQGWSAFGQAALAATGDAGVAILTVRASVTPVADWQLMADGTRAISAFVEEDPLGSGGRWFHYHDIISTNPGADQSVLLLRGVEWASGFASQTRPPADTATAGAGRPLDVTDTLGLTDAASDAAGEGQQDTLGLTDSIATVITRALSDSAGLTDSAGTSGSGASSATDQVALTDRATYALAADRSDRAGSTDATAAASARTASQSDSLGLTDQVATSLAQGLAHAASDAAALTDQATVARGGSLDRADGSGLTDQVVTAAAQAAPVTDTEALTDAAATAHTASRAASDTAALTDAVAVTLTRHIGDSADLTDTVAAAAGRGLAAGDLENLTDSVELELARAYAATDGVSLTDAVEFALALGLDVQDLLDLTDAFVPLHVAGAPTGNVLHPKVRVEPSVRTVAVQAGTTLAVEVRSRSVAVDASVRSVDVTTGATVDLEQ